MITSLNDIVYSKEAYFELSHEGDTTLQTCFSYFEDLFGKCLITDLTLSALSAADVEAVDQNLFSCFFIMQRHNLTIPLKKEFCYLPNICSRICTRCNKRRLTDAFIDKFSCISPLCFVCRKDVELNLTDKVYYFIDVDEKIHDAFNFSTKIHALNFEIAQKLKLPIEGCIASK